MTPLFAPVELGALVAQPLALGLQPRDLATGEVERGSRAARRPAAVAPRRVGLALQRRELTAHLAQQIVEPQEVALGRLEPTFGALVPLAELEDAGGLLHDRVPVLGVGIEHRVELTLSHDHVLLTADAGVRQQLLDVEQPAGRAVDLGTRSRRRGTACG